MCVPQSRVRRSRPGPYLVVGLARSGQAAARLLAARGERVIGVDAASPAGAAGLRGLGVEVHPGWWWSRASSSGRAAWSRAPGCPPRPRPIAAARERGMPVIGELELSWRLLPNRFCAVTGTNGKTTVDRAARPRLAHRRRAGRRRRQRRHAARLAGRRARARGDRDLRGVELPARGHRRLRPRVRGAAQRRRRPPRSPPHARRLPWRRSCACSPTRATTTSASTTAPTRPLAGGRDLGGPRARSVDFTRAARASFEFSLPGRPQRRQRRRRGGRRRGDGHRAERDRRRPAQLRRRPAPARAGGRDRRRALRQRLEGDQRRRRDRGAALVRRRRARDPRRLAQGRRLRRARRPRSPSAAAAAI